MKTQRVCDDLIIEKKSGSVSVWKIIVAVLLVGLLIWFVGWGRKSIPAFNRQNPAVEEESSDDYFESITYSVAVETVDSLDYVRNQIKSSDAALYDIILESLENKEFVIVNGIDGYTTEEIFDVAFYVFFDHPELCWYDGTCLVTSDKTTGTVTKIEFAYETGLLCDVSEIDKIQKAAEDAAAGIIATAKTLSDDYSKAVYVHDELVNRISYNSELAKKRSTEEPADVTLKCSMYGALVENSTVCQGYAQAFQYIMKELGIECVQVEGKGNDLNHAWNLVKLDGEYYYADLTWDDPIPKEGEEEQLLHTYCFVTSEQFDKDHTADMKVFLPTATATKDNYFVRSGLYLDTYSYDGAKAIIKSSLDANKRVEIAFANNAELSKAKDALVDGGDYSAIMEELGYDVGQYFFTLYDTIIAF